MTRNDKVLRAVYVDGETKTGKGAAGKAMARALEQAGYRVSYEVAGDFFRRYTALVRERLGLSDDQPLVSGPDLEKVAQQLYDERTVFETSDDMGDLQRPAISKSVAVLSELPLVQQAGGEWYGSVVRTAYEAGTQIVVLDGRNPRARVQERAKAPVATALDLYMTCDPEEAGRRVLRLQGIDQPTPEQLVAARDAVVRRREHDRKRSINPFLSPEISISFEPGADIKAVIKDSWQPHGDVELPLTVTLDNTHFSEPDMLAAVSELALMAVKN